MALHKTEQVLAAVATKLTGLTTTGARVFRGRAYPLGESDLPALKIYQGDVTPGQIWNTDVMDVALEVIVSATVQDTAANHETLLNLIQKEIAIALQADITQGLAFVLDTEEGAMSRPQFDDEAQRSIAMTEMTWTLTYRRSRLDPSA